LGRSLDALRVLQIQSATYRRWLHRDHTLIFETAVAVLTRWRRLMAVVRDLKQLSANQRLACYLLALTDRKAGADTVRLADDQLLMSHMLGIRRESLSRCFAQIREIGVSKRAKRVTISDIGRLRAYCNIR
jgi:CRP-like cAMP-binding protein